MARADYDPGIGTLEDVYDIFTDLKESEATVRERINKTESSNEHE